MKISDVRALSADQINDEILKLKKEAFNLRFQRATGQLEKPSRFREIRRTIARLITIANERAQGKTVDARAPKAAKASEAKAPKAKADKPAKEESETKTAAKKPASKKKED